MDFEKIVDAMIRLADNFHGLEAHPDFQLTMIGFGKRPTLTGTHSLCNSAPCTGLCYADSLNFGQRL